MKKIFILLLVITTFSCSISDDSPQSYLEILPVESVSMPEVFLKNQNNTINLTYFKPSVCHAFNNIYYVPNANEAIVAIVNEVYPSSNGCQETQTEAEASFEFRPKELGAFTFKFWQGEDENGEDSYYIVEIEVVE